MILKIKRLLFIIFLLSILLFSNIFVACNNNVKQVDVRLDPIQLETYAGDCQIVHPKVLYFDNTLFGYKYWMSYTPYPNANFAYENPCIAYSNDGYNWSNINFNPIVDTPTTNERTYNSDANLVYRDDLGILECWYREFDEINRTERIFRKVSIDGFVWSEQELLFSADNVTSVQLLSPSVIYEDNLYKIWVVAHIKSGYVIKYFESETGADWLEIRSIELMYRFEGNLYNIWHIDVVKLKNNYYILAMVKGSDSWVLFLTCSVDNLNYNEPYVVLLPSQSGWDRQLYRSCLVQVDDEYRIYYSARNTRLIYGLGVATSNNLVDFIKVEKICY